ncbi:Ribosomal small subunit Rsm22 [Chlamydiales bacterium STE3]|nr:Ribosomal small subunit Rsm22 [Chlamydiales bacterium STE3]
MSERFDEALIKLLGSVSQEKLKEAYTELSVFYKEREEKLPPLKTFEQKCAYLTARFPATFAAVSKVLGQIRSLFPTEMCSLLDLGAGPGTAFLAAQEILGELHEGELIERDTELIQLGKKLEEYASSKKGHWLAQDLKHLELKRSYDLIIASYSIGELSKDEQLQLLHSVWPKVEGVLVLIEPGTPKGFANIRAMREQLLQLGGFIIAPCPHQQACPMAENDWCHFNVRLERSKNHRLAKQATLSYEDEKFSFVAVAKQPIPLPTARIVRHPGKHSGHVNFVLCTRSGILKQTISKKEKAVYKDARKKEWGDAFNV